jgi:hypothetical protein
MEVKSASIIPAYAARNVDRDDDLFRQNINVELYNIAISRTIVVPFLVWYFVIITSCITFLGFFWNQKCNYNIQAWFVCYVIYMICQTISLSYKYKYQVTEPMIHNSSDYPYLKASNFLLFMSTLVVTICGTVLFFNQDSNCKEMSPYLEYLGIAIIIYHWVFIAMPYVISILFLCCLPCIVFFVLRFGKKRGANNDEISSLKTRQCTTFMDGASCCICTEDYKIGSNIKTLPCKHEFHTDCVDKWLIINASCPMCRASIAMV